jgi:hypothetical protein
LYTELSSLCGCVLTQINHTADGNGQGEEVEGKTQYARKRVQNIKDLRKGKTKRSNQHVGFMVLTDVVMKSFVFWDITPRSPLKVYRGFGGICRLHLQGRRIRQARNRRALAFHLLHARILLGLFFFDPEDRGDMFLRNVG